MSKAGPLGIFGGSTPDPSSWDYSPNRVIGGAFVNFEGGEYDGFHYSSTSWRRSQHDEVGRSTGRSSFSKIRVSYKRTHRDLRIAHSSIAPREIPSAAVAGTRPRAQFLHVSRQSAPAPGARSSTTIISAISRPLIRTLVGTGLLDKYPVPGLQRGRTSRGVEADLAFHHIWAGAAAPATRRRSLNQMYGITFGRLPWV